jgi:hypothetical protein
VRTSRQKSPFERDARAWLRERSDAAFRGSLLLAVPSIVFAVAPIFFVGIALFHRFFGRRLAERGVLLPAKLVTHGGSPFDYRDAASAWKQETQGMTEQMPEEASGVVELASDVAAFAGRLVPAVLVHYEFQYRGRRYRVAKYMFTAEKFYRDEETRLWALVDERHPRFLHWLVSRRTL